MAQVPRVLVLPGLGDSGPDHWQTLWEQRHGYERVVQASWENPDPAAWVAALNARVRGGSSPVVLVAHSLGCALVARWATLESTTGVAAALLVAPADVDSEMHTPDEVRGFSPLPLAPLPFPSIVVASRTDPYVRFVRAEQMAKAWGSRFVDAGRVGHINADSDVRDWPAGKALLDELVANVPG